MMPRATREEWAARIARWKESGLSGAAFGREIGVPPKTLAWWRKRLAPTPSFDSPPRALSGRRPAATRDASVPVASLNFIEMTTGIGSESLEVVLRSSVRIRVRPGFDSPTLGRLLDLLESRR